MTQATTSIDTRLVAMVGRKMYSSNPLPIIVRELLQNSVDACKRANVEPDISIAVRQLDGEYNDWVVVCEDNGIGMTEDQIVNDFLCLGGRKQDDDGQTGGFGIAKAAIMSCADWRVRTLDNYLDRKILENNGNIRKQKSPIAGTRITVRITESVWDSSIRKAIQTIYFSDVNVHFKIYKTDYPAIRLNDANAGMNGNVERKVLHDGDTFDLWGFEELELPEYIGDFNMTTTGWTPIRLNGLMQFNYGTRKDARKNNLVFDLKTDAQPEDKSYPFTLNREELVSAYDESISAIVESHNANVLQSVVALKEEIPEDERIEVHTGRMLHGSRETNYRKVKKEHDAGMGNQTVGKATVDEQVQKFEERSKAPVQLLVRRYKRDPSKKAWHSKLLLAWQDVLQIACQDDEEFGIGITSDQFKAAMRMSMDHVVYYVLNPDFAAESLQDASDEAVVLALWTLACHEATHKYVDDHNEAFTTTEGNILRDTSEMILRTVKDIAKRLR